MEFEKIVLCVIGGILICALISVCVIKHCCLPSNHNLSFQNSRSIIQVGAKGVVTQIPKGNTYDNVGDDVINSML